MIYTKQQLNPMTTTTPPAKQRVARKTASPKATAPRAEKPAAASPPAAPAKPPKAKAKLVRDSFTMPAADFELIGRLKERALGFRRPTKKSELLRAGLQVLQALDDGKLRTALEALVPLKPGRPKKAD
jgi:hypothetical protein